MIRRAIGAAAVGLAWTLVACRDAASPPLDALGDTDQAASVDTGAGDTNSDAQDATAATSAASSGTTTGVVGTDDGTTGDSSGAAGGDTEAAGLESWPASSVCLGDDYLCSGGIEAMDWTATATYRWRGEVPQPMASEVTRDGAPLFTVTSGVSQTHFPWGLAVATDGDLVLAGATAAPVSIARQWIAVDNYARVVARVSVAGVLRWSKVLIGVSAERILVAPQSDGGVVLVGDLYDDVDIDGVVLTGGDIAFPRPFAAKLSEAGAVQWASALPGDGSIQFLVEGIRSGSDGEIEMEGPFGGMLTLGDTAVSHPLAGESSTPAVVVLAPDGTWLSIAEAAPSGG